MDDLISLVRQAAGSNPAVSDDQIRTQLKRAKIRSIEDLNDELLGSIIDRLSGQNVLPGGGQEVESVESRAIAPVAPKGGKNRLRIGENAKAAMSSAFGVQDRAVVDMIGDAESRADQLVSQAREGAVEQLAQQMANAKLQAIAGFGEAFTQAFSIDNLLDGVLEAELVD